MANLPFQSGQPGLFAKTVAIFLVVTILAPSLFFYKPKKADAFVECFAGITAAPVEAAAISSAAAETAIKVPIITDISNSIRNTFSNLSEHGKDIKDCLLDALAYMIAKTMIQQMTQSIVNWINSGFEGSPAFLTDPGGFFLDIGDQIAGQIIGELGLDFLCDPFSIDVRLALAINRSSRQLDRAKCTLSDVIANMEGFMDGDFAQGGWSGWFQMTQKNGNNPYGSYVEASGAMSIKINGQTVLSSKILDWGEGFMSWEECEEIAPANYITHPNGSKEMIDPPVKGNCETKTPGSVIEAQINEVLPSGLRQLELADEFNEIITALMGQLVNQVMGGIGGLLGASGNGPSDSGSYVNRLLAEDIAKHQKLESPEGDGSGNPSLSFGNQGTDQSSTAREHSSGRAVDGVARGRTGGGEVPHAITLAEVHPYWQIDLGRIRSIGDIVIHRTTKTGNNDRDAIETVGNFRIFYSTDPFSPGFNPLDPSTWSAGVKAIGPFNMPSSGPFETNVNDLGRYVRIQRLETTNKQLMLAEVKILVNPPPEIVLKGDAIMSVQINSDWPTQDPGIGITDDKDGNIPASRAVVTGFVNTTQIGIYSLTYNVTDSGGAAASPKTRTVRVINQPPPTVDLQANPESVVAGEASTLKWTSQNSTSCRAVANFSTGGATSNTIGVSTGPLTATTTFSIACSGSGIEVTDSVTVGIQ